MSHRAVALTNLQCRQPENMIDTRQVSNLEPQFQGKSQFRHIKSPISKSHVKLKIVGKCLRQGISLVLNILRPTNFLMSKRLLRKINHDKTVTCTNVTN